MNDDERIALILRGIEHGVFGALTPGELDAIETARCWGDAEAAMAVLRKAAARQEWEAAMDAAA